MLPRFILMLYTCRISSLLPWRAPMCLVRQSFHWAGPNCPYFQPSHIHPIHPTVQPIEPLLVRCPVHISNHLPILSVTEKYSHPKVLHLEVEDLSLRTGHCKDSLTLLEGGTRYKTDLGQATYDIWHTTNDKRHLLKFEIVVKAAWALWKPHLACVCHLILAWAWG